MFRLHIVIKLNTFPKNSYHALNCYSLQNAHWHCLELALRCCNLDLGQPHMLISSEELSFLVALNIP